MRFDLIESAHKGEENYTGFTSEFISLTKGKGRCQLSFRVINQGAKFMVYVNATNAKSSGGSPVLIEETASFNAWKRYEATLDITFCSYKKLAIFTTNVDAENQF